MSMMTFLTLNKINLSFPSIGKIFNLTNGAKYV